MEERVRHLFGASIENRIMIADLLSEHISNAAMSLIHCLLNNGKLFIGGHGSSGASAVHFTTALLNNLEIERPALPVITLNPDYIVDQAGQNASIFSRQIQALGHAGDILILLTTSGLSDNLIQAVQAAHDREMKVVALTGVTGGELANHLSNQDVILKVPADNVMLIRETHLFILHCFCDLIEQSLFGQLLG